MNLKAFKDSTFFKMLLRLQDFILTLSSVVVVLLVVTSVFMRYVLKADFTGSEELITIVAMWLYYIGGARGSYVNKHIKADIIAPLIKSKRNKDIQAAIIHLITAVVLAIFSLWTIQYVIWNIEKKIVSVALQIPLFTSQVALAVGFLLMLFFTLIHLIDKIYDIRKGSINGLAEMAHISGKEEKQ